MANRLITAKEAAEDLRASLEKLGPACQRLSIYMLQTRLGGFPIDEAEFDEMVAKAAEELEKQ